MTTRAEDQGEITMTSRRKAVRIAIDVIAALACGAAALLTLADIHSPVRSGLTVVGLVLGTGWAATCWIKVNDAAFAATIAIASGLAIICFYALIFVEINWWHPVGSAGALLIAAAAVNAVAIGRDCLRGTRP